MTAPSRRTTLALAGLAALLAVVYHLLFHDLGLNPSDEGFLLYGLQRMEEGLFPVRDFQAYEPGRYVLPLLVRELFGAGIYQMRIALALALGLGLFSGLSVLRRVVRPLWLLVPLALVLVAWTFPRHKLFEPALAMGACHVTLLALERRTPRRIFCLGLFVGLAACIGRNHGVYGLAGSLLALGISSFRERRGGLLRELGLWAGGIAAGYAPMLVTLAVVPGFASSFLELVLFYVQKGTNQPLPYPWPWQLGHEQLGTAARLGTAFAFLLPALVLPAGLLVYVLRPGGRGAAPEGASPADDDPRASARRVLLACSCIGAFYAFHAAVRSDAAHLAQCFQPSLLGWIALPAAVAGGRRVPQLAGLGLLVAATLGATPSLNPLYAWSLGGDRDPLVEREVEGQTLRIPSSLVGAIYDPHRAIVERFDPGAKEAFLVPFFPTVYPYAGVRSPVEYVYFLWPFEVERQREIVRRLDESEARVAIVFAVVLDRNPATSFERTNPLVMRYLIENWKRRTDPDLPPGLHVYVRP